MTRRLFWEDMYTREFDAVVTTVDEGRIVLDQTAFNPRGGGLVSDTGTLGGLNVKEVVKEGDEIFHVVDGHGAPKQGDTVHGVLDWRGGSG